MKILVAPSSFKESLNSIAVARHIRIGLQRASKKLHITEVPLADGGSGTTSIITKVLRGRFQKCFVSGPLNKKIWATYGIALEKPGDRQIAIIELAEAAGLALIPKRYRNPLKTTTQGVGELILHAVDRGCKKVILGIGDSATIDCGVGALSVLGAKFLDQEDNTIELDCRGLCSLRKIDISRLNEKVKGIEIIIAADVSNVLTGKNGALLYARQKGATSKMIPVIDQALRNFKDIILKQYKTNLDMIPGAGAAGGFVGGMRVLSHAKIRSGFDMVKELVGLEERIKDCDLIITGEGRIDKQSFVGKATGRVLEIARRHKKQVKVVAGVITKDAKPYLGYPVTGSYRIMQTAKSVKSATLNAPTFLEDIGHAIGTQALLDDAGKKGL